MEKIRNALILESGEAIQVLYKTKKNDLTWSDNPEGEKGYLVLTNRRILGYKTKGVFNKTYQVYQAIPLRDVVEVTTGGRVMKHVNINGVKFFPDGADVHAVAHAIRTLTQRVKQESPLSSTSPQTIQQIVNVNVPPQPPIPSVPDPKGSIYCTQCGFQNDGDANFCKNCGTKI